MECNQVCKIICNEQANSNTIRLVVSRKPKCVILVEDSLIEKKNGWSDDKLMSNSSNALNSYANSSRPTAL